MPCRAKSQDAVCPVSWLLCTMIISKENRRTIYMTLFQEGVLVAPKNFEVKHPVMDVPNLEVVKAMQSLNSKGFVHTQFNWQWFYYVLTDEVCTRRRVQFRWLTGLGSRVPARVPAPPLGDRAEHPQAPGSPSACHGRRPRGCVPCASWPRWRPRVPPSRHPLRQEGRRA